MDSVKAGCNLISWPNWRVARSATSIRRIMVSVDLDIFQVSLSHLADTVTVQHRNIVNAQLKGDARNGPLSDSKEHRGRPLS